MKNKNQNIVLIGFMGCGKTTVAKELSKIYNRKYIDTDIFIQEKELLSIEEIFEKFGEDYFRKKEALVCIELSSKKNIIISTGGGVIKNIKNMKNLKKTGIILYLKTTPEKIYNNLKQDDKRPLLKNKDKFLEISKLLKERELLYEEYADIIIDAEKFSPFILAKEIKKTLDIILKSR